MALSLPEPIDSHHILEGFDCGKPSLNAWLKTRARSNQEKGFTAVIVVHDERSPACEAEPSGYISQVHVAKLSDVKNDLSRIVDRVRRGERVRILVRGVAAADIVPVEESGADELAALERRGVIRRGVSGVAKEILKPGPKVDARRVARALSAERNDRA